MRTLHLLVACTLLSCVSTAALNAPVPHVVPAAAPSLIEMPPLYVDARAAYAQKMKIAAAQATALCARQLNCPAVRVRRVDHYIRADNTPWTVVRLNACGEERVYEKTPKGWKDATWRLR
jgi:hypothetical protein